VFAAGTCLARREGLRADAAKGYNAAGKT